MKFYAGGLQLYLKRLQHRSFPIFKNTYKYRIEPFACKARLFANIVFLLLTVGFIFLLPTSLFFWNTVYRLVRAASQNVVFIRELTIM